MKLQETTNTFSKIKSAIGTVAFLKSAWADKHIVDALDFLSKESKTSIAELKKPIDEKIAEFENVAKYSTMMYETIAFNIIESEVFNALKKYEVATAPKFDSVIFMALIRNIKSEHSRFFPLRNFLDSKHLFNPRWILVPNPNESKQINGVDTAAATGDGKFIFNTDFMQKLLDYGHIKGLSPKSKKYSNNGGKYPPEYAYIEFLIIHELMHFTQADFHYGKIYKDVSTKIINFVGDFRSNYELVKAGYEQLPIGLYSDHINYDRQKTYKEMIDTVQAEMDKLPKEEQDKVEKQMGEMTDDHSNEADESEPGDGNGGEAEGTESDVEAAADKVKDSMKEKKDSDPSKPSKPGDSKPGEKPQGKFNSSNTSQAFEKQKVKPRYSWTALLSKAVMSADTTEETYSKPNRRSITGSVLAKSHGAASVKPGEMVTNSAIKLYLITDSSGSMSEALPKIYSNISKLLTSKGVVPEFLLSRFSDVFDLWLCNVKSDVAKDVNKKTDSTKVSTLFSSTYGGGTNLSTDIVAEARKKGKLQFNTILFSDSDILYGSNLDHLKDFLKIPNVYVIFDNEATFKSAASILKAVSHNISHL
jgi:hypothetical protein